MKTIRSLTLALLPLMLAACGPKTTSSAGGPTTPGLQRGKEAEPLLLVRVHPPIGDR